MHNTSFKSIYNEQMQKLIEKKQEITSQRQKIREGDAHNEASKIMNRIQSGNLGIEFAAGKFVQLSYEKEDKPFISNNLECEHYATLLGHNLKRLGLTDFNIEGLGYNDYRYRTCYVLISPPPQSTNLIIRIRERLGI